MSRKRRADALSEPVAAHVPCGPKYLSMEEHAQRLEELQCVLRDDIGGRSSRIFMDANKLYVAKVQASSPQCNALPNALPNV